MPPVGAAPDTQPAPQGPPPPISIDSEASKVAATDWHNANQKPLEQHTPADGDRLAPAEEAIPENLGGQAPTTYKVPLEATPSAPAPVDAATAFAPKPIETPDTPPVQAAAPPTPLAPPTYPTPDWEAMAGSTKAGAEPSTPGTESPAAAAFGELDQTNLDREAAVGPEMKAFYDFVSQNPEASLKMLELAKNEPDPAKRQKILEVVIPLARKGLDSLEKNIYPR